MKINKTLTALIAGASIGISGQAFAAGTAAGTTITNQVTLNYEVSGTAQAQLDVDTSFLVDNKIDMEISDNSGALTIIPGESITYTYTLTNSGNKSQIFELLLANSADATGTASTGDTGDITLPTVTYAFAGSNTSTGSILAGGYVTIPVDETATYTATFTYPLTYDVGTNIVNDDYFHLLATAEAVADTSGTTITPSTATDKNDAGNILAAELIVFAEDESVMATTDTDAAYTGVISVITSTTVETANFAHDDNGDGDFTDPEDTGPGLTVIVLDDPICNAYDSGAANQESYYASYTVNTVNTCATGPATYTPKAIPGALVEYTITAKNTGAVDASNVVFFQDIADAAYSDFLLAGTLGNEVTSHGTPSVDGANNELTVTAGTVAQDATVTITFTAIVE